MSADLFNIIFVGGEDRVDFLQGQVTQDIEKLDENTTRNAAFCNPKGRVIATCQLFQFNEKIREFKRCTRERGTLLASNSAY